LPASIKPRPYYLKALNGHGEFAAKSAEFHVSYHHILSGFRSFPATIAD